MAVAFGTIGTAANGSTTVAPSYPASIAAGDYLVCVVTSGATNSETPTTPGGWTLLATGASTDGAFGVDTGPRRVTAFGKVATGAESGTLSVSITNGNTCRGSILRFTKTSYAGWAVVGQGANDSTSGTGFSATTAAIDWAVGDCAVIGVGQRVDSATLSGQTFTATGITFGTRTNQRTDAVTTGNDHRHVIDTVAAVTAGSGSQAATYAYTASAAVSGGLVVVRLREVFNSPTAGVAAATGTAYDATVATPITFMQVAANASWTNITTTTVTGLSWVTGDRVTIFGFSDSNAVDFNIPTNANLTFSQVGLIDDNSGQPMVGCWSAVAASSQSAQTVTLTVTSAVTVGALALITRGDSGAATLGSSFTETAISGTVGAGDAILFGLASGVGGTPTKTPATGSGTAVERVDVGGNMGVYAVTWNNAAAGTFDWGPSDYTSLAPAAQLAVVLSAPASSNTNAPATLAGPAPGTANNATTTSSGHVDMGTPPAVSGTAHDAAVNPPTFVPVGSTSSAQTLTSPGFDVPANALVVVGVRGSRANHADPFSWAITDSGAFFDGTWTLAAAGTIVPAEPNAFSRSSALYWVKNGATPRTGLTLTIDAFTTTSLAAYAMAVVVYPAGQFDTATPMAQTPAIGFTDSSHGAATLPAAPAATEYAMTFGEGDSLTWDAPPAGWSSRAQDMTTYYSVIITSNPADADGAVTQGFSTAGSAYSCETIAYEIKLPSGGGGTNANAGLASATGTAFNATTTSSGHADLGTPPSATGTAQTPAASVKPPSGLAGAASGTAFNATTVTGPGAGVASGTGASQIPAPQVAPGPTLAGPAAGSAFGATVTTGTNANAGLATASGTAANATPTASGSAPGGVAAATGTASNATVQLGSRAAAGLGSGTGTAADASTRSSGNATPGVGSGTGTASPGAGGVGSGAGASAGAGTASNATTKASGNATTSLAGPATGTAFNAVVQTAGFTNAQAGLATASGTAYNEAARYIAAEAATASGTALGATGAIRATTTTASATGAASGATGGAGANPTAGVGAGAGTAFNAVGQAAPTAGTGAGGGVASDAGVGTKVNAGLAQAAGAAQAPTISRATTASAGLATASGTAQPTTVALARLAQAEAAFAIGAANGAVAYAVAPGHANAQLAHAIGKAHGADRRPDFLGGVPVLLEPQQLTVMTPAEGGPDGFGNATWNYAAATERYILGWLQQDQRSEGFVPGRDPKEQQWLLITNDHDITARDRIYWGAAPTGPITFEVEGPPEPAYRPGGFHHTEATLRVLAG